MVLWPTALEIEPGTVIKTAAYNNKVPGPAIRVREGQQTTIEVSNMSGSPDIVQTPRMRIALCREIAPACALTLASRASAGANGFGADDDDAKNNGPPFFGFVKDCDGSAIDDAKIVVTIKTLNASMVLHTNSQGHCFVPGFDKSIDPANVDIACAKDGYREVAHARKSALDAAAPVEVDCMLARQ